MLNLSRSSLIRLTAGAALAAAIVLPLTLPTTANAWWRPGFGVVVGLPAPVYVAPPVYAPPPVAYYAPPAYGYYTAAVPFWVAPRWFGGRWWPGHWRH